MNPAAGLLLVLALQGEPLPVPDETAVKNAEKLVREVFKEDFSRKSPADQAALARKLLKQAAESSEDPAARYVLLREAHDRATQSGDLAISLEALDRLAASFQINTLDLKIAAAATLGRAAKTPDSLRAAAKFHLTLADEALRADQFDVAGKAVESAIPLARSAKDLPTVQRAETKRREVKDSKAAFELIKAARETLARSPEDPAANEAVGRHECFRRNNWTTGLPALGKAADEGLRTLAARDLAEPKEGAPQLALAEAWWVRAEKEPEPAKASFKARAAHWYRQALPSLSGITRVKIEKRLAEISAAESPIPAPLPTEGLVAWWKFDETAGPTAADGSGGGHAGSLMGGPKWGKGKFGGALEFDGIDDHVSIPDSERLRTVQRGSYTISAWLKPARIPPGAGQQNDAHYAILIKAGFHTGLCFTSEATVSLQHWLEGGGKSWSFSDGKLAPGAWRHVAGVIDVSTGSARIYIDGKPDGTGRFPAGAPGKDYGAEPWRIGIARPNAPSWGWAVHGAIDEVRLYSRALSDEEVAALAREP